MFAGIFFLCLLLMDGVLAGVVFRPEAEGSTSQARVARQAGDYGLRLNRPNIRMAQICYNVVFPNMETFQARRVLIECMKYEDEKRDELSQICRSMVLPQKRNYGAGLLQECMKFKLEAEVSIHRKTNCQQQVQNFLHMYSVFQSLTTQFDSYYECCGCFTTAMNGTVTGVRCPTEVTRAFKDGMAFC